MDVQTKMNSLPLAKTCLWLVVIWHLTTSSALALKFNKDKLINLSGSKTELAADEGYLFLVLESYDYFSTLVIDRVGKGKRLKFSNVGMGGHYALIKLKAGDYYWKTLRSYTSSLLSFKFDEDDFRFTVKPGVVNYPGTWILDLKYQGNRRVHLSFLTENKASYDWIYYKKNYQKFVGKTPFEFTGESQDRYFEYIKDIKKKMNFDADDQLFYHSRNQADLPIKFYHIDDGVLEQVKQFPLLPKYLSDEGQVTGEINPLGDWVLLSSKVEKRTLIEVVDIISMKSYVVFDEELPQRAQVNNLQWIDNDTFLYDLDHESYSITHAIHLKFNQLKQLNSAEQLKFPVAGTVLDPLIGQNNKLLFANYNLTSANKKLNGLYELDISTQKSLKKSFKRKYRKTERFEQVIHWLADGQGHVRSAVEVKYDEDAEETYFHHWYLSDPSADNWVKISVSTYEDEVPLPAKLSADGRFFYAITDQHGDKQSIHKYSTTDYTHSGAFYEDPKVDIVALVTDPSTRELVGYRYFNYGVMQTKFFDDNKDIIKSLRDKNPELQLYVRQYLAEKGLMLIYGTTLFSKGTWYLYNLGADKIFKLMDVNPGYEKLPKGENHQLQIAASDGVNIEGYLVKPVVTDGAKPPLVVIPHGGPIGVRDYANNDDMQHFLAAKGIASLKVNYRGSGGFGKEFEKLGNQQWGEKIEADIHAMVLHASSKHQLDLGKVCAMGGSYGGYSAVMLTILYPEIYQCAVSLAGVMDLPLLFSNNSLYKDEAFFEKLAEIVGDPVTDLEQLVNKSPFYLAEKISKPIKLFHGISDRRVTLEHSMRMQQMFTILGMEGDLTLLENEAHSMKYLNSNIYYVAESLKFIIKHLDLPIELVSSEEADDKAEETVVDFILDANN